MATQEIPREEWTTFFDRFSKQHEGWRVSLEVFGPEIGAQQEANALPFEGITVASHGKEPITIAISLGKAPEDHVTHTIAGPKHVWLQQTSEGADEALEIESEDGAKTLLRFRSAVLPEMVDGVVSSKATG